jgi:NTE family protein
MAAPANGMVNSVSSNEESQEQTKAPTIGLCLSGGGFRAAFYALGAVRYLSEGRLLSSVKAISAVSGGSLAAGKLAAEWPQAIDGDDNFTAAVLEPMRRAVAETNIRNRWLRAMASGRGLGRGGRGALLGEELCRNLALPVDLADLPDGPQVIFTSTCLQTGRAFRFARAFTGSWDFGYIEPTPAGVKLGTALAASAAFPLTFTVVQVPSDELKLPKPAPPQISLVDGGVYDNLGLEWFQGSGSGRPGASSDVDFVLAINASGVLEQQARRFRPGRSIFRDLSVQYSQTLNFRVRWFVDQLTRHPGSGLYVGINRDPRRYTLIDGRTPIDPQFYDGALPSSLADRLSVVRTDLDRFTRHETALLAYHGYWSTHARLATFRPELAVSWPRWRDYADLSADEEKRLAALLDAGRRVSLKRRPA